MGKIFMIFAAALLAATSWAQAPQKMSYQAVIRNGSDVLVSNTQIGMEINIHQGSPTGAVVYTETQTPSTNANGLVSIEIGIGVGFDAIDWSAGPYFIETKTAIVPPLTTYTITGTSQLLSVPYSLHAKTAETLTGGITETDPVYTGSQASNITATDITNLNNLSGSNSGDQDLSGLATTTSVNTTLNVKVDKVAGKGLSTEDYTTTEKTKLSGIAEGAEVNIQADWNQTTNTADDYIKNKPAIPAAVDGSETKLIAGNNISITGNGTNASPYLIGGAAHYIGELYGGGVVFWVDHTGEHGLIVSMVDLSSEFIWSNISDLFIGTTNDWDGAGNTTAIIGQAGHTSSAAKLCDDYTNADYGTGTYSDWYLPSIAEFNHIWNNLYEVQKSLTSDGNAATIPLDRVNYWSSSEYVINRVWSFDFDFGRTTASYKNTIFNVRTIRAF